MKKWTGFAALAAFAALLLPISNLVFFHGTPFVDFKPEDPDLTALKPVFEKKCLNCHSANARVPYYAAFPVARQIIQQDITLGTQRINLEDALDPGGGKPVDEATLAKLELAAADGSMPPPKFLALHWDSGLNGQEKALLKKWIAAVRLRHYATGDSAPEFKADILQPLPLIVSADARKVKLGSQLYHDKRLSGDNTVSCATCHGLDIAGGDARKTSLGIRGQVGPINAPTVFNSAFNHKQFWDGRAADLQEQAAGPVENPKEMGAQWPEVIARLRKDEAMVSEFSAVYPAGLSKETVTDAIAEFEKTLITPNSRFDRYLRGDKTALSAEELEGYRLFRERGCVGCHVGKAMGGQSFEKMGKYRDYFKDRGQVNDADNGRFSVTKNENDKHKLKVPTLRNVALTEPYFHDGSTRDLKEAVKVMMKYQTKYGVNEEEAAKIEKFLQTLTGEYEGKPLSKKSST